MIVNLKDITTNRKIGSVGLSVCKAPSSGVMFTQFEVNPTPMTTKGNLPSFIAIKQETMNKRGFGILELPHKETISRWKSMTSLLQ